MAQTHIWHADFHMGILEIANSYRRKIVFAKQKSLDRLGLMMETYWNGGNENTSPFCDEKEVMADGHFEFVPNKNKIPPSVVGQSPKL